jgi:hypothetical protein
MSDAAALCRVPLIVGLVCVVAKEVPAVFFFNSKEFYWVTDVCCWEVVSSVAVREGCVVVEEYVSFDVWRKVVCLPSVDTFEFFS